ncbi:transcription initiation factor TFIID subunit 4 isoform X2 [Protopterus annectens]|uniref:transcription initiation factor TFIID subunit 4 isoform X2 n=1 Tax=Protopterus annectens TaxID=7888 RepID=UPI001CF9EB24|nr:transcription initiation factor TFIID subunit 4 isoform X2 [Protopterus annectens]
MAAGSDLLDDVFFNTEVDEKVVSDIVGSLESHLAATASNTPEVRPQGVANHVASSGVGSNANAQTDSKMGLAQEVAKGGAGVQGGVINNTRSQGSAMDATVITSSSAGSEASGAISQGKSVVINAMATNLPNHGSGNGKIGTSAVQTLNGSNVVMNSHNSGSAATFTGTNASSTNAPAVTVVNNGPGSVVKGSVNAVLPTAASTVIQTSYMNTPNVSSTVISPQGASLGPTVTLVRTPIHTGHATTQNGNSTVLNSALNVASLPVSVGSGVSLQPPLLNSQPASSLAGNVALTAGTHVMKSESPKSIIQATQQLLTASSQQNTSNMVLGQPMQGGLPSVAPNPGGIQSHPAGAPSGITKTTASTASQNILRTPTVTTTGGIRATMAPPVLAPRLPHASHNPSIQNFQLPPGMVLVRSDSGQLLMIHQQALAQMQAQAHAQAQTQSQNTMTQRSATPTSAPAVQLSTVQAPGTSIIARQVTPTTIIKPVSQAQTTVPATTTLQRPPVVQPQIVLGGTTQTAAIGPASSVQPGTPQRPAQGTATATDSLAVSRGPARITPVTLNAAGQPHALPGNIISPMQPQPGMETNSVIGPVVMTVTPETMENVKKCKNFLSTLIKLASSGKQSTETAANVKELVQNLLDGKIEPEDFTSRLYRELNSSPQPYLVPFLKRSLPALRQLTPDSAAFIQQSQHPQPIVQATTALTAVVLGSSVQRTAGKATATVTSTLQQPVISLAQSAQAGNKGQHTSLVIQQAHKQGQLVRSPHVALSQSQMVTLRTPSHRIMVTPPQVQVNRIQPVMKPTVLPGAKGPPTFSAQVAANQKNKLKDTGGGFFRDDDDINDVASMAGVNLSEESARILATNSELVGTLTRSCKDETFLLSSALHRKIMEIGKKYGVTDINPDVINYVSHATQQRLQNLVEKISETAQQRNISYKDDERYEQTSDVRMQLKFFEQLDQIEKQRKDEQEREILMRAAKSRSRQEDPEQLRLKQKAKEMQQQELAQMRQRDANLTALAAIGPRKKRKVDSPGPGTGTEGSGTSGTLPGSAGVGTRQFTRQRITRVNLRDLIFCLENERETSHSLLLYKAFLK